MIRLFDTHLLLWAAYEPERLSDEVRAELTDPEVEPMFSAASIWEVSIKAGLGRPDFTADSRLLRRGLLDNGYRELSISSAHAAAVIELPMLHRDPFDRMLVAQSRVEGVVLFTCDEMVAQYGDPVRLI